MVNCRLRSRTSWAIFPQQSRIQGPLTRLPLSHLFGGLFMLVARVDHRRPVSLEVSDRQLSRATRLSLLGSA